MGKNKIAILLWWPEGSGILSPAYFWMTCLVNCGEARLDNAGGIIDEIPRVLSTT